MTTAQRARLVVAMGLLNLILATVALTAGVVAPTRPGGEIAVGSPSPTSSPITAPASGMPTPTVAPTVAPTPANPGASLEPTPSAVAPSTEPSVGPSATPVATPAATGGPIVAVVPTPTPTPIPDTNVPQPTARPTAKPTPRPTVVPTPRPTPTPQPVVGKVTKPRPPCPDGASGPPGHRKVLPPPGRPCNAGHGQSGGDHNGMVLVLPLALGGLAATLRTRIAPASRRIVRAHSKADRRRGARSGD